MPIKKIIVGFASGFLATLIFHQIAVAILHSVGVAPFGPWNMTPTAPLGIPAVLSLSFWGGIWGIVFVFVHQYFGHGYRYWISSFLFGGVIASAVALLIVVPLKGGPVGAGWAPMLLLTVLIVNGVWGVATAIINRLLGRSGAGSPVTDT